MPTASPWAGGGAPTGTRLPGAWRAAGEGHSTQPGRGAVPGPHAFSSGAWGPFGAGLSVFALSSSHAERSPQACAAPSLDGWRMRMSRQCAPRHPPASSPLDCGGWYKVFDLRATRSLWGLFTSRKQLHGLSAQPTLARRRIRRCTFPPLHHLGRGGWPPSWWGFGGLLASGWGVSGTRLLSVPRLRRAAGGAALSLDKSLRRGLRFEHGTDTSSRAHPLCSSSRAVLPWARTRMEAPQLAGVEAAVELTAGGCLCCLG
mmetsp:Transcript_35262/g.89055  ORF Transcript_35262/g.89055 Transcript_35262/m.89055 type:complete len:259 (-) Transcript_35262:176-952(-)